ncbi:MAG: class I fructose-bisphosphate aldolase [Acidimicrobiaceae bacterium]|nr:class I fructose-bisphosphate aldolase [Acidimicrobiaceae bacterium]MBO0748121.1 class I fructose-bisphosphate aldolase [Acidimicrobiaceae bacterium]
MDLPALLGADADELLNHKSEGVTKDLLTLPGPDFMDQVASLSDRPVQVLRSLGALYNHGRLAGTGYLSILPVDQGIEHSGVASFSRNPIYFDPKNIVELAIEGGCNGVATTLGGLSVVARRYAHKIPFIVKLNHNELLTYPNHADQILFGTASQAFDLGAAAVGATIYFGSEQSDRQIQEISNLFDEAHDLGMFTVLWCYLRNDAFKHEGVDYELSADLTGQANHIGVTIKADIVKQKQAENNGGYTALKFGRTDPRMYETLTTDNPIDLTRWQVLNCYAGRVPMINSGGASGSDDLGQAVRTAVINKRAGGAGLITGRKAFMKPMDEGIEILNAVQDVYLDDEITVA